MYRKMSFSMCNWHSQYTNQGQVFRTISLRLNKKFHTARDLSRYITNYSTLYRKQLLLILWKLNISEHI
jgi:hypothetical protein